MKQTTLTGMSIACSALLLAACQATNQDNPLMSIAPEVAAHFLVEASSSAEHTIGHQSPAPGNLYRRCMTQTMDNTLCDSLYSAMVTYAEHTPPFTSVTIYHLSDTTVWETVSEDYQRIHFNRLPE